MLLTVILNLVQTSSSGCKFLKHVWHDSIVDYAKDNSAQVHECILEDFKKMAERDKALAAWEANEVTATL